MEAIAQNDTVHIWAQFGQQIICIFVFQGDGTRQPRDFDLKSRPIPLLAPEGSAGPSGRQRQHARAHPPPATGTAPATQCSRAIVRTASG